MSEPKFVDDEPLDAGEIEDVKRLQRLKAERDSLTQEIDFLTEWLAKRVTKDARIDLGEEILVATVVRGTSTKVDLDKLQSIDPELAKEVTKAVLDSDKLKKARDLGFFAPGKPETDAISTAINKPYVKFTKTVKKETASAQ